tara:strand:- start:906 stop:2339 length:1434 start_codon:yes stop_codon:yes gene_type:complete
MADITEIIEESAVQLEIVETGGGQIEVVEGNSTLIEIVETTLESSDLNIAFQTNTVVVESVPDNINIDISIDPSTTIETTTTTNVIEITENQVIFQTGSIFQTINNTIVEGNNGSSNISFQTSSNSDSTLLSNLIIKDFSNDVSINVNEGVLELIFGNPTLPTISDISVSGFNTNRFNLVTDSYTLTPQFNLNGTTFIKGMLSSSTEGITTFNENDSITITPDNFSTYAVGSHIFTINIIAQLADNSLITISSNKTLTLNKLNPLNPTITNVVYDVTSNAYRDTQSEIEEGATGNVTWLLAGGLPNGNNGWVPSNPELNSFNLTLTVNAVGNITTGNIEQYWNSSTNNNPQLFYTGTISRTWTRVRSLRFGTSISTSFNENQLQDLTNWQGTIKYGFNTESEIESLTLSFSPNTTTGEYLYIVYDSSLSNINTLINQLSLQNEITAFNSPEIVGNYKVYRTTTPKDGSNYQHKITFV